MKSRIKKCVAQLKALGLDAIVLSNPVNTSYLSDFRDADGYLLVTRENELIYFTNFIYEYEAKALGIWKVVIAKGNIFKQLSDTIKSHNFHRVGFEAKNIPYLEYSKIKQYLLGCRVELCETIDFVEKIRAIKEPQEISLIKKATEISKDAFDFSTEIRDRTMTEKQLNIEIEKFLRIRGSGSVAFPAVVAYGANSAIPHHIPSKDKKLTENFFLIDLGAKYYEYCADLTRVFTWGKITPFFKRIYDIVRKAQDLSIKKIRDGVAVKEVDLAARSFIEKKGYGKFFGHGVGHGVGREVHEIPFIGPRSGEILEEGMVVTIEPAIYLDGKFGIRIEDMVLVGKNKGEVLSGNFCR
ncbi:MAG: Xaa-Pro peptidase family protein [Candidatus Omnitrophica bacterium]|jgi:Xaa-Pro aminopeptidase|nr:Xaa-Pro peptidase family protein [Candidatus Omnitrophota bacterium]